MKNWLLLFFNLFSLCLFAENVPLVDAKKWAVKFFQNQTGTRGNSIELKMVWDGQEVNSRTNSHPAFYIFNREDSKGFVIVAGDNLVNPIIGYSLNHEFKIENLPNHIHSWLMNRKKEINFIRKNGIAATLGGIPNWNNSISSIGNVLKKIETAEWNQGAPYNNKCPIDTYTGRPSVTGCVATAFAIALRAREWPNAGMGMVPSYSYTDTQGNSVTIPQHSLGHSYHWDKMPLNNLTYSSSAESVKEVSTLMEDCGKMARAMYSSQSTGAFIYDVAKALRKYLKYSPNVNYELREYYSSTTWHAMIQNEIKGNGPVIYGGVSTGGGHAFILDGYTDKNYYSVNWGWGGTANGYYTLSLLNPEVQGIGGSDSADGFNIMQDGIFSMKKAVPGEVVDAYPNFHLISFLYNQGQQYFYGLVPTTHQIKRGEKFMIGTLSFANLAFRGLFPLEIAISVFNKSHQHKEIISNVIENVNLPEYNVNLMDSIDCTISKTFEKGDYIAVGYRPKGCTEWKEMKGGYRTQSRIPLLNDQFASTQDALVLSSGTQYDDVYWGLESSRKNIRKNQEFFVKTGYISNTAFEPFKGKISVGLYGKDGNLKYRVTEDEKLVLPILNVEQCVQYTIQSCKVTSDIEEGDYIALCCKAQGSDIWKRISPLTGVNGKINLQTKDNELILDRDTSLQFDKQGNVIKLSTLADTSFDWRNSKDESLLSGTSNNTGALSINVSHLEKGTYKLILKNGTQSKIIQIIL